jgi:hypothetical protein
MFIYLPHKIKNIFFAFSEMKTKKNRISLLYAEACLFVVICFEILIKKGILIKMFGICSNILDHQKNDNELQ